MNREAKSCSRIKDMSKLGGLQFQKVHADLRGVFDVSLGIETGTTVWKIPEQRGGGLSPGLSLQNVSSLPGQSQRLKW